MRGGVLGKVERWELVGGCSQCCCKVGRWAVGGAGSDSVTVEPPTFVCCDEGERSRVEGVRIYR